MFGWLKKRKKNPGFKEIACELLTLQLVPKYQHASKAFGSLMTNDMAAGYVFGFHDCLLQRMKLYDFSNPNKAFELIEDSYKSIFGNQAGHMLFSKSVGMQDNSEFQNGRMEGGNEIDEFLSSKTPALGLGRMLVLGAKQTSGINENNPISRFEKKVQDWPAEQSLAAAKIIKSFVKGSGDSEKYFDQLTISQLEAVKVVLEEIEPEL